MIKIRGYQLLLVMMAFLAMSCNNPDRDLYPDTLVGGLKLLSPETTGIDFNNEITETNRINHIYYNQIYSGAGVAIGDIDNDGLSDIYFCGNLVNDRLYLNKGNLKFEDITKSSKAAQNPGWSWGVTMADVNNDGYLDIYVSRNGESMNPKDRRNQLYINNQDLTFTESAIAYGLADEGFSSQAVFFDMDNDGDLDMYQVNQLPDSRLFQRYNITTKRQKYYTDKLYRNDNGKYADVSEQTGISRMLTSGLSVSASDFNNDGWVDLYVSNDYDEPDFMFYNNGDGTFKNVIDDTLKHISRFSMGIDTGDINNDGLMDLITLDMAAEDHYRSKANMGSMSTEEFNKSVKQGGHYQYMFNTLQLNSGSGGFSDIAQMAGIANTDWSWSSLLVDLDNDGWKDIVVSNGIKKDVRNNDFITGLTEALGTGSKDYLDMVTKAPSVPLSNYVFRNKGDLEFENVSQNWSFDTPSYSSGMAYGDLDNDGDLDLVTNNMEAPAFVYENMATGNFLKIALQGADKNRFGFGVKAKIHHNGKQQVIEHNVTRGYFSSVEPGLFFGLGKDTKIDSVEVIWPDGKTNSFKNISANTSITAKYADAKGLVINNKKETEAPIFTKINSADLGLAYQHKENEFNDFEKEILLPHRLSQNGPFSEVADVNGDGLEDLFIGGAAGQSGILYIQNINGQFTESASQPWAQDKASEDMACLFIDVDGDKDKDLLVTSGGNEFKRGHKNLKDRLYINNGSGNFVKSHNALPPIFESSQCVKASDIDADGDLDVFVGTRLVSGKYPFPATSYLLINDGGKFKIAPKDVSPDLTNIGMVTDAVFTDIDQDGDKDLMLVGEWMQIIILENDKGIFINSSDKYGLNDTRGLWWSVTASDLDNDGDEDYVLGNLGKNNKFKASVEHPFKIYANDFDDNGTNDIVLAKYYKNDYVPLRGRECTSEQMPYVAEKFKDYHSFASSKLLDILPEEKLQDAVVYEISNFESIILINDNGQLIKKALPSQAQMSPIKSSIVADFNKDGFNDILAVGNHYGVEVETVRYDAGIGTLLLGDAQHNFKYAAPNISGIYIPTDSRHVKFIEQKNKKVAIVTNNNAALSVFSVAKN